MMVSRTWRTLFSLITFSTLCLGQKVSIGGVIGSNITGDFPDVTQTTLDNSSGYRRWSNSHHFILGPKVEIRFDNPFSIEINALHREIRSQTHHFSYNPPATSDMKQVHTTWQFPVLAKYQFRVAKLNPFLAGGASFRPTGTQSGLGFYGLTAGTGLNFQVKKLNISPTLRYTRWSTGASYRIHESTLNQVEFLVGFDQSSDSAWPTAFGLTPRIGAVLGVTLTGDLDDREIFQKQRQLSGRRDV